jgi:hypothetical protein
MPLSVVRWPAAQVTVQFAPWQVDCLQERFAQGPFDEPEPAIPIPAPEQVVAEAPD